jgi:pectate lyase
MKLIAILFAMGTCLALGACATSGGDEGKSTPRVVRGNEDIRIDTGGIPPDKQADVYLVLQQRDASARRCYQDVLNEKKTRDFKGTVKILLSLNTNGTAKAVKVTGGSLNNKDVENCLVQTIKEFEFPTVDRSGDIQYDYKFEPQY